MKMKPKIQDIASETGVSPATVSLVLTGKGKISDDVSKTVLETAEKMGYRRSQQRGSISRYIAVLTHCTYPGLWAFLQPFIEEIQTYLIHHDYYPIFIHSTPQATPTDIYQSISNSGASALIGIHYHDKSVYQRSELGGIPVVILNNSGFQKEFHTVCVDDFQGAYEGTQYLLELGHKNLLFFEYERPNQPAALADRYSGFMKAVQEENIKFSDSDKIVLDIKHFDHLQEQIKTIMAGHKDTTAIFAHDDYLGAYIYKALLNMGIKIPDDISLLAPGDVLTYNEPFVPQITTMRINTGTMGELAARTAISIIEGRVEGIQVLKLKEQLIDRGSCRSI